MGFINNIREVWQKNFHEELVDFEVLLDKYSVVSFDTEFPGFLKNTPRDANEAWRYEDLKFNIGNLKLIQLGLTLSDDYGMIGGTWEFNFRDFDKGVDDHVPASIKFLEKNGLNLEKLKWEGIEMDAFVDKFVEILSRNRNLQWVTFHGLYDLAYVLKLVTKKELPESVVGFVKIAGDVFGRVYDVKFMARYCKGLLGGELGLEKLSKILTVERVGGAHQAGSDSLLTALVYAKMRKEFQLDQGNCEGYLYGISPRIVRRQRPVVVLLPPPPPQRYCQPFLPFNRPLQYYPVPVFPPRPSYISSLHSASVLRSYVELQLLATDGAH